ncbi:MAG: retropepsin-like aspartic protease [Rhizomicrobium sp.]
MHGLAGLLVVLAFLAAPARAAQTPDYFAPRAGMDADTALYLDAWSGNPKAMDRLRARLERAPQPADAYDDWSFLCHFEFHRAQYAKAIPDCEKAIAVNPKGGDASALATVRLLARLPLPRAHGAARAPVTKGVRVPVKAGAYDGPAIADTGAQISAMMQSVAKAAHVKLLGALLHVDSTTAGASGRIGLIPEVRIGNATVEDIPVLVLPDAELTVTEGKETVSLPFILSLYALADFGRIAWLDHDRWLALGSAAPQSFPNAVPMIWSSDGIAVPLQGPHGIRGAQFDSGTDVSYLYDSAVPLLSGAERASIVKGKRMIGSVGGVEEQNIRRVPVARLTLAGQPLVLKNVNVAKGPDTGEAARLGEDVLGAYSAVVFDFGAMTFSIAP